MKFNEPNTSEIKAQKLYREMGLTDSEFDLILDILKRDPNYTETGIFSAMWSEHCSYKHSKPFLKQFPTKAEHVLMGPGEGAGAVDIGDNQAVVFKVESHNHPSAVDPYEGAATGIGGIVRDIVSIGARPIGLLNSLRFGELSESQNQWLLSGVTKGMSDYGNTMELPAVSGEIEFDPSYHENPLVNAMGVGLINHDQIQKGTAKGLGNKVVYVGLPTGRDGINGASFASGELTDDNRPEIQKGNPQAGKLLMEATLKAIDMEELVGIQDMGAAGLTSSSAEMADKGNSGMVLYLDKVPVTHDDISPYEMMLSETQERMLLVVENGSEDKFLSMFEEMGLKTAVIGEVTDDHHLKLFYNDELFADLPVAPLSDDAPVYVLEGKEAGTDTAREDYSNEDLNEAFDKLISHPTMADKSSIYENFNSTFGGNTVQGPGFGAGIVNIEGTDKAISMVLDGKSRYVYADPYNGGKEVVAMAYRSIIATGAKPLGMTNCLNYGSPEKPEIYKQLELSTKGMAEACETLQTPVVSGNVSLYNEHSSGGILPTPIIGMVGLIEDVSKLNHEGVNEGDAIYLVGQLEASFAGSQLEKILEDKIRKTDRTINLEKEFRRGDMLREKLVKGEINKIAPLGRGGLIIKLAQLAAFYDLGVQVNVSERRDLLFSESASKYLVIAKSGLEIDGAKEIGQLTKSGFTVQAENFKLERTLEDLKSAYEGAIPACMNSEG